MAVLDLGFGLGRLGHRSSCRAGDDPAGNAAGGPAKRGQESCQEEGQEANNTSTNELEDEPKMFSQAELDNKVKERVGRAERNAKRKLAEKDREIERYKQLESTLRAGLDVNDDIADAICVGHAQVKKQETEINWE